MIRRPFASLPSCSACEHATRQVDIVPIPGTKRRKYREENVGALSVRLTSEDLARINQVAPKGAAAGLRYPAEMMHAVGR